nr:immunoglobulin light chain junction region [Macaca mulatta]MOX77857.1 immunoglobulin light chain junction region [Macaca mulatta]MOX79274.1 immunoglobulin light chain junction region [Macaca mulatta]MOX79900.1 immunoglobulin light chain junction region [Macaca mulatta]MOX80319.1 immunoglobulin light chain junction region [Macaca mulatta]
DYYCMLCMGGGTSVLF